MVFNRNECAPNSRFIGGVVVFLFLFVPECVLFRIDHNTHTIIHINYYRFPSFGFLYSPTPNAERMKEQRSTAQLSIEINRRTLMSQHINNMIGNYTVRKVNVCYMAFGNGYAIWQFEDGLKTVVLSVLVQLKLNEEEKK